MTPRGHSAVRLRILMSSHQHWRHHSLASELMHRARTSGLAGATLFKGHEGWGHSGHLHHAGVLSDDRPESLVIVDSRDKIERFLTETLADMDIELQCTLSDVEVLDT